MILKTEGVQIKQHFNFYIHVRDASDAGSFISNKRRTQFIERYAYDVWAFSSNKRRTQFIVIYASDDGAFICN